MNAYGFISAHHRTKILQWPQIEPQIEWMSLQHICPTGSTHKCLPVMTEIKTKYCWIKNLYWLIHHYIAYMLFCEYSSILPVIDISNQIKMYLTNTIWSTKCFFDCSQYMSKYSVVLTDTVTWITPLMLNKYTVKTAKYL